MERGREAKTVVCISRPWGAYVRQQPFCPRPLKERRHPLPKPIWRYSLFPKFWYLQSSQGCHKLISSFMSYTYVVILLLLMIFYLPRAHVCTHFAAQRYELILKQQKKWGDFFDLFIWNNETPQKVYMFMGILLTSAKWYMIYCNGVIENFNYSSFGSKVI